MCIPGIAPRFKNYLHTMALLNRSDLIYHTGTMQPGALRTEANQIQHSQDMSQRVVG